MVGGKNYYDPGMSPTSNRWWGRLWPFWEDQRSVTIVFENETKNSFDELVRVVGTDKNTELFVRRSYLFRLPKFGT